MPRSIVEDDELDAVRANALDSKYRATNEGVCRILYSTIRGTVTNLQLDRRPK